MTSPVNSESAVSNDEEANPRNAADKSSSASNVYQAVVSAIFGTEEKPNEISTDSESQEHATKLSLTLAVMLLTLLSLAVVVWLCLRSLRSVRNTEVSFQGLRTDQIVGKIRSKN